MDQETWTQLDDYFADRLLPEDAWLDRVQAANLSAGLPPHEVTPHQGKLLSLLARMARAKSILEIGTLGGYSALWLARALPKGGRLVTIESDPKHAAVARRNFEQAGLSDAIELLEGPALDRLPELEDSPRGRFDMIFIDADKQNNPGYFAWALRLSRPGTVIVVDNVARRGSVADPDTQDSSARGVQALCDSLKGDARIDATAIQTVGKKGHDGFLLAIVKEPTERG